MPFYRTVSDVCSVKIEASYPAWLYAGREKSWHCAWRSSKSMCRNDLCGFQGEKAACAPLCSRTVAKPDWFYSGAQSAEPESFSPVLGESLKKTLHSCEIEHLLVYSVELKDSGTERCKKSNLGWLSDRGLLLCAHSHTKSWEISRQPSLEAEHFIFWTCSFLSLSPRLGFYLQVILYFSNI